MTVNNNYKLVSGDDFSFCPAGSAPAFQEDIHEPEGSVAESIRSTGTEAASSDTSTAAAIAGGVVGLLLGGPIVGLAAGIGVGYAATIEGRTGDIARATGDVAISVGQKAKSIDEQHHVTVKVRESITSTWGKLRQCDDNRNVLERIIGFFRSAGKKALECEQKTHILENLLSAIANGATMLVDKLRQSGTSTPESDAKKLKIGSKKKHI